MYRQTDRQTPYSGWGWVTYGSSRSTPWLVPPKANYCIVRWLRLLTHSRWLPYQYQCQTHKRCFITFILIPPTPCLLNSARLHRASQNFVVPWKIHTSQKLIIYHQKCLHEMRLMVCMVCLCKLLLHMGPVTGSKIMLKLQKSLKMKDWQDPSQSPHQLGP